MEKDNHFNDYDSLERNHIRHRMQNDLRDMVRKTKNEIEYYDSHFSKKEIRRLKKMIADLRDLANELDKPLTK